MKFCLVTTFFPPEHFGGDAVAVTQEANLLAAAGHEVDVVCCADSYRLLGGKPAGAGMTVDPRVRVHRLSSTAGLLGPLSAHQTGLSGFRGNRLREILDQDFDIVHWHNISLIAGPRALAWARGKCVLTLHDYWFLCPTSILFRYDGRVCTERRCIRCSMAQGRPPQWWRSTGMLEEACRLIDLAIAPSNFVRTMYRESGLPLDPVVLPHFAAPVARVPKSDGGYYLVAGRLTRYKGVQNLLAEFAGTGRRLWIAGAGPYESELRRMASGLENVRFLGRVPHSELAELYAGARATLVPSICWETFGMTVIESLQQATPVITSDFGALPELLDATGGGRVYHSADELRQILNEFDSDPEEAARIGGIGHSRLDLFAPERYLQSLLNLIRPAAARQQ